ncbi:MAG: hypothetical protein ACLUBI_12355 [Clostridium sp.]|uniref:hypothetical protein n=1 Tax=Clostridium sp. TaxID=1506 RepID=UPI0039956F8C
MNYKIIGKIKNGDDLLGTCFLINKRKIISAYHVIEKITDLNELNVEIVNKKIPVKVYYWNSEIDFLILDIAEEIEADIEYSDIYLTTCIECGDKWESAGYPVVYSCEGEEENEESDRQYLKGDINRIIEVGIADIELNIYDQIHDAEWEGMSGAPLIIDNRIMGVIIVERKSMLLSKLKCISMEKIIGKLYESNESGILEELSYKSNNLLSQRCETFHKECLEKFKLYKCKKNDLNANVFVLRPEYSINSIAEIIHTYLIDYANELQQLLEMNSNNFSSSRKAQRNAYEAVDEMKKVLLANNKMILTVLWVLLEGNFKFPRIAFAFSMINNDLKRDIYIDTTNNNIKLLISYADCNNNMIDSLNSILYEIENEIKSGCNCIDLFIWDNLALEYLDLNTKLTIEKMRNGSINGEKINIDLVILNAYSSTLYNNNAYKFISKNDQILSNRINKDTLIYTSEIIKLNDKYKCINIKDVNWICLPLESIEEFNSMFAI